MRLGARFRGRRGLCFGEEFRSMLRRPRRRRSVAFLGPAGRAGGAIEQTETGLVAGLLGLRRPFPSQRVDQPANCEVLHSVLSLSTTRVVLPGELRAPKSMSEIELNERH